jgi:prolyl oligopeptidase
MLPEAQEDLEEKLDATETFYAFTSFTYPTSIYRYDIASGVSSLFARPKVDFNPEQFESKQVWFESKDGTEIPMFIVHKKGLNMDGERPTYLYAYGGFNISLTPSFSPSLLLLLENDGVYAMPNLRGGGEFGEDWHEAGHAPQKAKCIR